MGERKQNNLVQEERAKEKTVLCEQKGQILIIMPLAELDHHCAVQVRTEADERIDEGRIQHLLFDFSRITFMDSSGIGVIMGRYKKVLFQGGRIACCGVGKEVDRILTLSGLYRIMPSYPDRAAAERALKEER